MHTATPTTNGNARFEIPLYTVAEAARFHREGDRTEHALASRRLYTDGAVILYDYAEAKHDEQLGGLTEVVSRQRVFSPVVEQYLTKVFPRDR